MDVVLTRWAVDSYMELKGRNVFTDAEYWGTIRPDALLLQNYPNDQKFSNGKFWSLADKSIPNGYKMKWHQIGNGLIQLRLPVALKDKALLCCAYAKNSPLDDKRMLALFKGHMGIINDGKHKECGILS